MAYNVLIVDDSTTMRALIRKVLGIAGFPIGQYFESANGKEALEVLKHDWVDVILSDMHMPEMDGMTLLKTIRQDEVWKNIPIVMITTEGRPEMVNQFSQLGVQGYIKKPFRPEDIKAVLSGILGETDGTFVGDTEECDF